MGKNNAAVAQNFQRLNSEIEYVSPSKLTKNAEFIGEFLGSTMGNFNKLGHKFRREDGSVFVINGTGQLDKILEGVKTGTTLKIVYAGQQTIKKGQFKGKKAHNFEVYAALSGDTTTTPASAPKTSPTTSENASASEGEGDEDGF